MGTKHLWRNAIMAGLITTAMAGCGTAAQPGAAPQTATTAPSPTATATATAAATATSTTVPSARGVPTVSASTFAQDCGGGQPIGPVYQVGGVLIQAPGFALSYPNTLLPNGLPLSQPYQVPLSVIQGQQGPDPATNPTLGSSPGEGYAIHFCNGASATAHTVSTLTVRITSAAPHTGTVDQYNICDGPYDTSSKAPMGGCGGGFEADEYLHVDLSQASTVGTTVTAKPMTVTNGPTSGIPFTIKPGATPSVNLTMTPPSQAGAYQFAVGISIDGQAAVYLPMNTPPVLIAPIGHTWTGQACVDRGLVSQIPTTSQETLWLCAKV